MKIKSLKKQKSEEIEVKLLYYKLKGVLIDILHNLKKVN